LNVEDRLESLEKRVQNLEETVLSTGAKPAKSGKSHEVEALIVSKIDDMGTQDLILIALKLTPKQTKTQIKTMLEDWGKAVGNWFQGGNFNSRLLKKSIVKKDGADHNNDDLYSLTMKGEKLAQDFLDELRAR
jgi:hypothetical protein